MIEAASRGSMLPPARIRPTRFPRKRSGSARTAASPAAPAPSAIVFCSIRYSATARSMRALRDQHHVVDDPARDLEREPPDVLDRDAFGERVAAALGRKTAERRPERRVELGLDADDRRLRGQRLNRGGDAGDEAAAADRHHDASRDPPRRRRSRGRRCPGRGSRADRRRDGRGRAPVSLLIRATAVSDSPSVSPSRITVAPKPRVAATFTIGVGRGMTMVAGMPRRRRDRRPPAHGCRQTWRPRPRSRSAGDSDRSLTSAPRSLKDEVACRFSYLMKRLAPVSADSRGAGRNGVRSTTPAMRPAASRISASVGLMPGAPRPSATCRRSVRRWAGDECLRRNIRASSTCQIILGHETAEPDEHCIGPSRIELCLGVQPVAYRRKRLDRFVPMGGDIRIRRDPISPPDIDMAPPPVSSISSATIFPISNKRQPTSRPSSKGMFRR